MTTPSLQRVQNPGSSPEKQASKRLRATTVILALASATTVASLALPADGLSLPGFYANHGTAGESEYGSYETSPAPAASVPASAPGSIAPTVVIEGFDFGPELGVQAGETINVINNDGVQHTVTAVDGSFTTPLIDGAGEAELVAPTAPGRYQFFCTIHPSMKGVLDVS